MFWNGRFSGIYKKYEVITEQLVISSAQAVCYNGAKRCVVRRGLFP